MADDLMDFSYSENRENSFVDVQDENARPCHAPSLVQSPVIVNSILKQSTKDNLIQLFTPVQKPVKGKLKVRFGSDSLLETPVVKAEKASSRVKEGVTIKEEKVSRELTEEEEEWVERTSVLTKQDHEEYTQMAGDILHQLVTQLPIQEETESEVNTCEADGDVSMMDISENEHKTSSEKQPVETTATVETSDDPWDSSSLQAILAAANAILQDSSTALEQVSVTKSAPTEPAEPSASTATTAGPAEEQMDCEEAMDVDETLPVYPVKEEHNEQEEIVKTEDIQCEDKKISSPEQEVENKQENKNTGSTNATDEKVEINTENSAEPKVENVTPHQTVEKTEELPTNEVAPDVESKLDEQSEALHTADVQVNPEEVPLNKTPKDKTGNESSDEEFMSADEDVDSKPEGKTITTASSPPLKGVVPAVSLSPGRTPPKVGYCLDFDDLDMMNPFAAKTAVANSPDVGKVKAQTKVMNSPVDDKKNAQNEPKEEEITKEIETKIGSQEKPAHVEEKQIKSIEEVKEVKHEPVVSENKPAVNELPKTTSVPLSERTVTLVKDAPTDPVEPEQSDSPERIPPKVGYSLNFDDLDMMDPFATKTGLNNSPDGKTTSSNDIKPKTGNGNKIKAKAEGSVKANQPATDMKGKTVEDKKEDKFHSANTSPAEEMLNSSKQAPPKDTDKLSDNDAVICSSESNTKALAENSSGISDSNPHTLKDKMKNSPNKSTDNKTVITDVNTSTVDEISTEQQKLNGSKENSDKREKANTNVVQKKKQPAKKPEQSNAEKKEKDPETKEGNSENDVDKIQIVAKGTYNFDDIDFDSIDPFKPKKQMTNSPDMTNVKTNEESNTTNEQQSNSCARKSSRDISKDMETNETNDKTDNENVASEKVLDVEPSVTSSTDEQPLPTLDEIALPTLDEIALPTLDEIDPFKPGKQMQNSPIGNKKDILSDLENVNECDLFKPKKQICNSPGADENKSDSAAVIENPVENKDEVPDVDNNAFGDIDPFESKSKVNDSPKCKSKPQVATNAFADLDPFKTTSKIANSPDKTTADNKKEELGAEDLDAIDPFKPKTQMANSPVRDPFVTKSKVAQSPQSDKEQMAVPPEFECGITGSDIDDIFEIQGVARRGDQPVGTTIQQLGDCLDFDEAQFVPASQVFNGPGVWEMLEQFGSHGHEGQTESSLSRMSLYVKFDPLVDAAPINPRRISIKPAQLEKVKEYGLDETLLLLGTPPKKRRQSMGIAHQRNTPSNEKSVCTKPLFLPADSAPSAPGGVDLILEYSPSRENTQEKKEAPKKQYPSGLSLLSQDEVMEPASDLFQELKYTDTDLRRLRAQMQLELQGQLLVREAQHEKDREELQKDVAAAKAHARTQDGEIHKMGEVCLMFESTMKELAEKKSESEKRVKKITEERDQAVQDTLAVENAFSDLHRRYEKMKNVLATMMQNEEVLKKALAEHVEKKKTMDTSFQSLKKQAEENASRYAAEIQRLKKNKEEEKASMEAKANLLQMKYDSMEKTLQQKAEENRQLTDICENLLSKYQK